VEQRKRHWDLEHEPKRLLTRHWPPKPGEDFQPQHLQLTVLQKALMQPIESPNHPRPFPAQPVMMASRVLQRQIPEQFQRPPLRHLFPSLEVPVLKEPLLERG
jgi:hypothetical protein